MLVPSGEITCSQYQQTLQQCSEELGEHMEQAQERGRPKAAGGMPVKKYKKKSIKKKKKKSIKKYNRVSKVRIRDNRRGRWDASQL